jgi:hypothetical protein
MHPTLNVLSGAGTATAKPVELIEARQLDLELDSWAAPSATGKRHQEAGVQPFSQGRLDFFAHEVNALLTAAARPTSTASGPTSYSVSRDFVRSCQTPMLVMPDDTPAHPYQTAVDIASLTPNAEVTVFPWREPPELKERTIN